VSSFKFLPASPFNTYRDLYSITSYGDRPNDYESVVNYFRAHFLQVHRKNNEKKRVLYSHLTNAVVCFQADLLVYPFRSRTTIRISKRHVASLLMVSFIKYTDRESNYSSFCSSRFHIQGLFEICCSRVKVKRSV
jgi:hypothetical protein